MNSLMTSLLDDFLIYVVLPEVAAMLRRDPTLTDEQIIARWSKRRSRIRDRAKAFREELRADADK